MKLSFLVYDNDSSLNDFPLGIGYLISTLRKDNFDDNEIDVFNMDVYHYSDEELFAYLNNNQFDVVCIGMIAGYWQYRQLNRMINVINKLKKRPILILGGFMFSPEPEFFMRKTGADYVVVGEGEATFSELIKCIANREDISKILGLAYWTGNKVVINERRKPVNDLDSIPMPAWDKFPIENYVTKVRFPKVRAQRSLPIISSRGCLYKCSFCYRMEKGYRTRSLDSIMEECKKLIKDYHLNSICFRDELLMSSEKRSIEFAERIIKEELNIMFDVDGRVQTATPEVLKTLKKAGCVYINFGVESLDQQVLDNMNKHQTIEQIIKGVEATIEAGINPGLNVIYGNIGDNRQTARKTVDFLKKYNTYCEMRTLKPVTPYPGSPLYYLAIDKGLIQNCEDFYENKHLNSDLVACNFTELSIEELYDVLYESNKEILNDHFEHLLASNIETHKKLYFEKDINFRGVRC